MEILSIQSLKEVTFQWYTVDKQCFESLLELSKNQSSHIQKVCFETKRNPFNLVFIWSGEVVNSQNDKNLKQFLQNQIIYIDDSFDIDQTNNIRFSKQKKQQFDKFDQFGLQSVEYLNYFKQNQLMPSLSHLQELWLTQQNDYKFLNSLFESKEQRLVVLDLRDCELTNIQIEQVDFNKLPKSMEYLNLQRNLTLTSSKFLEPLFSKNNINKHINMKLNLLRTSIPPYDCLKFIPCVKKLQINLEQELIYSTLKSLYDNDQEQLQLAICFYFLFPNNYGERQMISETNLLQKQFYHQKIEIVNQKFKKYHSLEILSPLQLISTPLKFQRNLKDIFQKQRNYSESVVNKEYQSINRYLFQFSRQLQNNNEFTLGYSKNYHGDYFYIQNLQKDNLTQEDIFWNYLLLLEMQEKKGIKEIHLPINLSVSQELLHNTNIKTNIDEIKMIENLSRIPPSEIILSGMSVQFIKTWYVINVISPLVFSTKLININEQVIYNTSIGNYLTKNLHRNNFLRSFLCGTSQTFRFDETVELLSLNFEEEIQKRKHLILLALFPLYLFVCIFGVIYFSVYSNIACGEGVSSYSYYTYIVYGIFTLWIELLLFKKCLNYISHLIPSLEIDLNPGFIISFINKIKQKIIDTPWINQWYIGYSYSLIQSQIARFDNFTNVGFLYSTYSCGDYTVFYIALSFMSIPLLYSVFQFFRLIFKPNNRYQLPTTPLDAYYTICNIVEFRAVSDILDLVSPSNVISLRGRMYNARIVSYFLKIICENMPLVIIQIYNLTKQLMTSSLVLSLILSIITFLSLLLSMLTITPSTLNQEDFNKINEKKQINKTIQQYEERLQTVEDETFALRFYHHLKHIRLQYLSQQGKKEQKIEPVIKYYQNIRYFDELFGQESESEHLISDNKQKIEKKEN